MNDFRNPTVSSAIDLLGHPGQQTLFTLHVPISPSIISLYLEYKFLKVQALFNTFVQLGPHVFTIMYTGVCRF